MLVKAYKRFRMQVSLPRISLDVPELPTDYRWAPWRPLLLERHAQVKWRAFREDLDGKVFGCLRDPAGCLSLMKEIASQNSFCPLSTWMVVYQPEPNWPPSDVGTIQGVIRQGGIGAIQNVGVAPEHRRLGIGKALVLKALQGFYDSGMAWGSLEVTAENIQAVRLYQEIGFETREILYRDGLTGEIIPPNRYSAMGLDVTIEDRKT